MIDDGKEFYTDEELARMIKARIRSGETPRQIAKDLGIRTHFVALYAKRDWPHANPPFLKAIGFETKRYYRRRQPKQQQAAE